MWKEELGPYLQVPWTQFAGESKEKPGINVGLACIRDEIREFRNPIIQTAGKKG
jgi:hypothetical protein